MKYDIFISFSTIDQKIAESVCGYLESNGYRCFVSYRDIPNGKVWARAITEAIDGSSMMVAVFSKNFDASEQTDREIELASENNIPILTYRISDDKMTGAKKYYLKNLNWIDAFPDPDKHFGYLLKNVERLLGNNKVEPVIIMHNLKIETNADCAFYVDGEKKAVLKAGVLHKIQMQAGEYQLLFISLENNSDKIKGNFLMPDKDKILPVDLLSVRKARLEKESDKPKTFTVNGVSFEMMAIKGGTFTMGATSEQGNDAYDDEKPAHGVTLSNYHIGKFVVTQELWMAVMGNSPSNFKGDNLPVECVSWNDVQLFIKKLNQLTGKQFRLPTEAEWEYAARGGSKSKGFKYSGGNTIGNVAWYNDNSHIRTHNVGTKSPNEFGLYDMSGNVYEWCQDWYGSYCCDSQTNPTGPSAGSYRVLRGGGWSSRSGYCRVSLRNYYSPDYKSSHLGFRLVLVDC